jgi:hypothetical protein
VFCSIGESGLSEPFSVRMALPFFRSVRLRSGQVAARLLHTLGPFGEQDGTG